MNTAWKTLSVAAALFAGVSMAQAATPGCMEGDTPHRSDSHLKRMSKELGLDARQKQQIKDIQKSNHDQIKPLMDKLKTERRAMRALVHAETVDEAAIRSQSALVAAIQADLEVNRAHMGQKVRAVLTPDQQQKFKALQEKRDHRMDERRAKGPGRMERN